MNEQLAKIHAMRELFSMFTTGKITREEYEVAIKTLFPNQDKEIDQQDESLGAGDGESSEAVEQAGSDDVVQSSEAWGSTQQDIGARTLSTSTEFIDQTSLPIYPHGETRKVVNDGAVDVGKSQKQRILELLGDGEWHTNTEIMQKVYDVSQGGYCNYKARIDELRNEHHNIPNAVKVGGKVYRYRLIKKDPVTNTFYGGK